MDLQIKLDGMNSVLKNLPKMSLAHNAAGPTHPIPPPPPNQGNSGELKFAVCETDLGK